MSVAGSQDTFRDPAGFLRIEDGRVLRTVRPEYAAVAVTFLNSDIARQWMADRRLVPTVIAESRSNGEVLLEHERIAFPSYPWEWTPGQWVAAAELTLDFMEHLLGHGYILKDATPLNVLFDDHRPVFVDVLSVEPRDPENPLWLAYGQFVRTFLLPLAAHKYLGWPLAMSIQRRDGYEPSDLYVALSSSARWLGPCRSLVSLPHFLEKKKSSGSPRTRLTQAPEVAQAVLRRTIKSLRGKLRALITANQDSKWSDYPETADHYSQEDNRQKQAFIVRTLQLLRPEMVLDIGGNTGMYSRIAAETGARVIAWDTDVAASEKSLTTAMQKGLPILPLIADIARPTPATGWRNRETSSLLERAYGRFDCVMALGVIHHLLLTDQIPMGEIAALLWEITRRWAIIEWVPATDVRFKEILRGRDSLYGHLDEQAFLAGFQQFFSSVEREQLGNGRILYLFEKK